MNYKKIVLGMACFALVAIVTPGVAQGATIEELLVQIAQLQAQIAQLQAQPTPQPTSTLQPPSTPTSTQPSVTVTSPNGGEMWQKGLEYAITWNLIGIDKRTAEIYIKVSRDGSGYLS